jgi:hypothetical protein
MAATIRLSKGERLSLRVTAKTDGAPITLDSTWQVAAAITSTTGNAAIDMQPLVVGGKVEVDFDTAGLAPGTHTMDMRFTNPDSRDQFSKQIKVQIDATITAPSPR